MDELKHALEMEKWLHENEHTKQSGVTAARNAGLLALQTMAHGVAKVRESCRSHQISVLTQLYNM